MLLCTWENRNRHSALLTAKIARPLLYVRARARAIRGIFAISPRNSASKPSVRRYRMLTKICITSRRDRRVSSFLVGERGKRARIFDKRYRPREFTAYTDILLANTSSRIPDLYLSVFCYTKSRALSRFYALTRERDRGFRLITTNCYVVDTARVRLCGCAEMSVHLSTRRNF